MRIRALETLVTGTARDRDRAAPGALLEVDEDLGRWLVETGKAVLVRGTNTKQAAPPAPAPQAAPPIGADESDTDRKGRLRVNVASAERVAEVMTGIGLGTARDIVHWRKVHGPFAAVDDLTQVAGVGKATISRNRKHLTVE